MAAYDVIDTDTEEQKVDKLLDKFFLTASMGQYEEHVSCFSESARFLGTDDTERWTIAEYAALCKKVFRKDRGWTWTPARREVVLHGDSVAWFCEEVNHRLYGDARGCGVAVKLDGEWKIERYVLSCSVPNDLILSFAKQIRKLRKSKAK